MIDLYCSSSLCPYPVWNLSVAKELINVSISSVLVNRQLRMGTFEELKCKEIIGVFKTVYACVCKEIIGEKSIY